MAVTLRKALPEDEPFLYRLYASTRAEEMDATGWDEQMREIFLHAQFRAQAEHYTKNFPDARHSIILVDGKPAGRFYVNRTEEEMRLVDLSILPEYRNGGTGTRLIREMLAEAESARLPVRLHVLSFNPALKLYERLGFTLIEDKGLYLHMERRPEVA
ncbi:MAG TPA: GNAT family N-acetyltransferase [Pyrinomonadaceae bacterium]|nr:GNAT family N-acetyltransferase [Pyrinomonadaceae bacterium]